MSEDQIRNSTTYAPQFQALAQRLSTALEVSAREAETPWTRLLVADAAGAVDFTVYPMLALALRLESAKKPDLAISEAMGPRLTAWMARVEALPYFQHTYPPHWRKR